MFHLLSKIVVRVNLAIEQKEKLGTTLSASMELFTQIER